MPANKKHLTKSPLHRILKITAGFAGGYVITELFFMVLIKFIEDSAALISLQFAGFMLWATMMILAFIPKSGFKTFIIYTVVIILMLAIYILLR